MLTIKGHIHLIAPKVLDAVLHCVPARNLIVQDKLQCSLVDDTQRRAGERSTRGVVSTLQGLAIRVSLLPWRIRNLKIIATGAFELKGGNGDVSHASGVLCTIGTEDLQILNRTCPDLSTDCMAKDWAMPAVAPVAPLPII